MYHFGSKATTGLCQPLIALMPPHGTYIETHLGGGAIMKRKPPALRNIGIDLNRRALADFACDYPVELVCGCAHRFSWLELTQTVLPCAANMLPFPPEPAIDRSCRAAGHRTARNPMPGAGSPDTGESAIAAGDCTTRRLPDPGQRCGQRSRTGMSFRHVRSDRKHEHICDPWTWPSIDFLRRRAMPTMKAARWSTGNRQHMCGQFPELP